MSGDLNDPMTYEAGRRIYAYFLGASKHLALLVSWVLLNIKGSKEHEVMSSSISLVKKVSIL
jgi:hypothetical protein